MAASPVFNPAPGTYTSAQSVSLQSTTSGATIYYTTDGSTPTRSSLVYTSPIAVNGISLTIKAFAAAVNDTDSPIVTGTYVIQQPPATPSISPAPGTYTSAQTITISSGTTGAAIYYTTDGSVPNASSTRYTAAFKLSASGTVKAIALINGVASPVASAAYIITTPVTAAPVLSLAPGTYTGAQTLTMTDGTAGAVIYYTTDGTTPTTASANYAGALTVSTSETVKAFAVAPGASASAVVTAQYTIQGGGGTISYGSGFPNASGLILNGWSQLVNGVLQMTDAVRPGEASSVYALNPVSVQNFTTDFTFRQNTLADGITLVLQNSGPSALGNAGGGLGYGSDTLTGPVGIGRSVALKLDLYSNSGEGPDSTGVYTNGASPTTPAVDMSASGVDLHSGDLMAAHVVYDGANLALTLTDTVTGKQFTHSFAVDIPAVVGSTTAYVGFTAGSGGAAALQQIFSWTYAPGKVTPVVNYVSGFTSSAGLTMNRSAQVTGGALQLTTTTGCCQTSAAYYQTPVNVQQFTSDFTFLLLNAVADGFTFVLQNQGLNAYGIGGASLGYGPRTAGGTGGIQTSVALKFDLHNNVGEGSNSTGVYTNGAIPTLPFVDMTPSGVSLHSGNVLAAHVVYDGVNLTLTLTDTVTGKQFKQSFPVNIPSIVGASTAWAGFTAGTGNSTADMKILTWGFHN